jgi:acetoacetyl-CoA synthetase
MRPPFKADQALITRIKEAIRKALSARHVPKFIFETPAIPVRYPSLLSNSVASPNTNISSQVTVNLKKVELPVKQIVSGKKIKPSGTLLNPESLDFYYQFAEIEKLADRKAKL